MKSAYCTFLSTDSTLRYLTKQLHDFKDCKISHQKQDAKIILILKTHTTKRKLFKTNGFDRRDTSDYIRRPNQYKHGNKKGSRI